MRQSRMTTGTIACLVVGVLLLVGCETPGARKPIDVEASYLGLNNRSVAVLVSTSDHIDFKHPDARRLITEEIARRIMINVPGVKVTDPTQIIAWQAKDENRYWAARPPSAMVRHFAVDRLVLVEIGEYRTHDPGDKYVLRGIVSATVNIYEAETGNPDNPSAMFPKNVMYPGPKESKIGRVGISEKEVEFKTQVRFCEETAGLFFDHTIIR